MSLQRCNPPKLVDRVYGTVQMRKLSFSDLAYEIISLYVRPDDIPAAELKAMIHKSFSSFRNPGEQHYPVVLLACHAK